MNISGSRGSSQTHTSSICTCTMRGKQEGEEITMRKSVSTSSSLLKVPHKKPRPRGQYETIPMPSSLHSQPRIKFWHTAAEHNQVITRFLQLVGTRLATVFTETSISVLFSRARGNAKPARWNNLILHITNPK